MTPGFRYHFITIVALFLMLGLGVLLGSSLVMPAVVQQHTKRLETLSLQFQNEIVTLRDKNRHYAEVMELLPSILQSRLANTRAAIIQTGDYPSATAKAKEWLEKAGVVVPSTTVINQSFVARLDRKQAEIAAKIRALRQTVSAESPKILPAIAAAIARGGKDKELAVLVEAGLIDTNGDYASRVDYVIIVGGAIDDARSRADSVDLPLVTELKAMGIRVVAAEPELAGASYVTSLRPAQIPTVDNVDTDIGQNALLLALLGPPGDYGVKRTATNGRMPVSTTQ